MQFGKIQLDVISAGKFWLDGGAMFGIIPKTIWTHLHPPDENNRILMDTNCPLIQTSDGKWVLVDTGNGMKFSNKEQSRYRIEPGNILLTSLKKRNLSPADIDIVILSHLHFDHIGGCTYSENQQLKLTFPNAKYFIQKDEWEDAIHNRAVMTRTYLEENFLPLKDHGVLELVDGSHKIHQEVSVLKTGGHTRGHQATIIQSGNQHAIYFGDLIPMASHIHDPYIMAYDTFPLETLNQKKELIPQAVSEKWLVIWDHDPYQPAGYIQKSDTGRFIFKETNINPISHCCD